MGSRAWKYQFEKKNTKPFYGIFQNKIRDPRTPTIFFQTVTFWKLAFLGHERRRRLRSWAKTAKKWGKRGAAGAASDTGASRGHIAFLNQQAYIRDFDVEVAQASFIADPQIDVLQSGTVLDATVIGGAEKSAGLDALRAIRQGTEVALAL